MAEWGPGLMIGNLYSVAELEDLLAQKDQELPALEKAWRGFDKTWMGWDPASDDRWLKEFNALKARYQAARTKANLAIALSEHAAGATALKTYGLYTNPLSTTVSDFATLGITPATQGADIPADLEYRGVLSALQKVHGVTSPGDFQDLWDRLQNAINAHATATGQAPPPAIYDPPAIQPRKGTDLDLLAYQRAKRATTPPDPKTASGMGKLLLVGAALGVGGLVVAKTVGKVAWKALWPL